MYYFIAVSLKLGSVSARLAGEISSPCVCGQKGKTAEGILFSFKKNITYIAIRIVIHIIRLLSILGN
jgi:hypothetical protein